MELVVVLVVVLFLEVVLLVLVVLLIELVLMVLLMEPPYHQMETSCPCKDLAPKGHYQQYHHHYQ